MSNLSEMDWSAPPKADVPEGLPGAEWKVDEEPRGHDLPFCIYAVPRVGSIRLIAKCEKKSDAELIVSLYEQHREGLS